MYKLKITILFSCMILISIIPSVSNAIAYNELVPHVAERLGVNNKAAEAFLRYVNDFIHEIQNNFTKIASHNTPRYTKGYLTYKTIENYFKDDKSEVQVSSLKTSKIKTYTIHDYLTRLSEYSLKYKTVKVYFDKSYLSMGKVHKFYENGKKIFEFEVKMWQMFEGCLYDRNRGCYKDYTKKGFHLIFIQNSNWEMKVDTITADKAVSLYPERRGRDIENIFR